MRTRNVARQSPGKGQKLRVNAYHASIPTHQQSRISAALRAAFNNTNQLISALLGHHVLGVIKQIYRTTPLDRTPIG